MRSIAPRRLTGAACSMAKLMALALERKGRGPWAIAVARSLPRNNSPGRLRIEVFIVFFFFVLGPFGPVVRRLMRREPSPSALSSSKLGEAHVKRMNPPKAALAKGGKRRSGQKIWHTALRAGEIALSALGLMHRMHPIWAPNAAISRQGGCDALARAVTGCFSSAFLLPRRRALFPGTS